jgi:hypothetical protein
MNDRQDKLARRAMLAGTGAVGALAAAATLLPGREPAADPARKGAETLAADSSAGYRLTDHVKQYYRTTRV